MPSFLEKNQTSFTTEQANLSRKVTTCRWSVESANGRIKNKYTFWDNVVPISYLPIINSLFRITCAIINRFSPVLLTETLYHQRLVDKVELRVRANNELKQKIEDFDLDNRRDWLKIPASGLEGFPTLMMADLYDLTCGVYQVKNISKYNARMQRTNPMYEIFKHKVCTGIVKVLMPSRFHRSITHKLWIEFDTETLGLEAITGYYCRCQIGSRVLGCCSHVCAVLFHLGIGRHEPMPVKKSYITLLLDAAERYSGENGTEIEDPTDNIYLESFD
ncbi:unnamed protein product [Orchesella dallaii]|uniref:DDE Tnp4 domain-containing protein n=1 Tax=Orchesella dallaii TaxID=48710 RepID=A0ABP1QWD5_9HEXA